MWRQRPSPNAGAASNNRIKPAAEFSILARRLTVAGVGLRVNTIPAIGLKSAWGLLPAEPYDRDMNEAARAIGRRCPSRLKTRAMPFPAPTGQRAVPMRYRKTEAAMRPEKPKASGGAPVARNAAIPARDAIYRTSVIRDDGRVSHAMYLSAPNAPASLWAGAR